MARKSALLEPQEPTAPAILDGEPVEVTVSKVLYEVEGPYGVGGQLAAFRLGDRRVKPVLFARGDGIYVVTAWVPA